MSIPSFLKKKGAIGLIIAINDGCETFTEIKSEMTVSQTTVSERIGDADDVGLLDSARTKRYDRTTSRYMFTDRGKAVAEKLKSTGTERAYKKLRMRQQDFDEASEEVVQWSQEEAGSLLRLSGKVDNPRERREKVSEEASEEYQEGSSPAPNEYDRSETPPREQLEQTENDSTTGVSEADIEDTENQPTEDGDDGADEDEDEDVGEELKPSEETESTSEEDSTDPNSLWHYDQSESDGK